MRNKIAHVARKLQMPPNDPDGYAGKLDAIDWGNYKTERSYGIREKRGGRFVTISEPKKRKVKKSNFPAPIYSKQHYKDDVVKGKWV